MLYSCFADKNFHWKKIIQRPKIKEIVSNEDTNDWKWI